MGKLFHHGRNDNPSKEKKYYLKMHLLSVLVLAVFSVTCLLIVRHQFIFRFNQESIYVDLAETAEVNSTVIHDRFQMEFDTLTLVGDWISEGMRFDNSVDASHMEAFVRAKQLCILGYADRDGNVMNYRGEAMGNIQDRRYFYDVISGKESQVCEYLEQTRLTAEPRFMFSIPVYENNEIIGVLFSSKEESTLSEKLFSGSVFSGNVGVYVVDADCRILVGNGKANGPENGKNILEWIGADDAHASEIRENMMEGNTGNHTFRKDGLIRKDGLLYIHYSRLKMNGWTLFLVLDNEQSVLRYSLQYMNLNNFFRLMLFVLCIVFLYGCVITIFMFKGMEENRKLMHYQNRMYRSVMRNMNCSVVEYDVNTKRIVPDDYFKDLFEVSENIASYYYMSDLQFLHPELPHEEMKKLLEKVVREKNTAELETVLNYDKNRMKWIRIILIPVMNYRGDVQSIYAAVQDRSEQHIAFETAANTVRLMPGGMHRCYLSEPIHLEYVGEGLLKMLGYTKEELDALIGKEGDYSKAIHPEDREKFGMFVTKLSKTGGNDTCEYRLICKDGTELFVSDTMEAHRSSNGIMYGYAVVTDFSALAKRQQATEEELEETRKKLEQARIRISTGQMQPHFLYNALASIREIVLEDPEYASDLIYYFTTHLRACIKSMSSDTLIPFRQEIDNIDAYVNIEKMRFGDKLKIIYDIQEEDFSVIPLGIQPLVENAIRHGIYQRGAAGGTVEVHSRRTKTHNEIVIKDNGVGFDLNAVKREIEENKRDSTGITNLIYRFELVMHATVSIDSIIGEGTTVTVQIPLEEEL